MTIIADIEGTQWGVGHGGFHTQSIKITDGSNWSDNFTFIYDCGSLQDIASSPTEIESFANSLPTGGNVDLLTVSHFDQDHISGLKELGAQLAKRNIGVSKIFAPFLTTLSQIILGSRSNSFSYISAICSPSTYFADLFPNSDTILLTDEGGDSNNAVPATGSRITIQTQNNTDIWEVNPYVPSHVRKSYNDFLTELGKIDITVHQQLVSLPQSDLAHFIFNNSKVLNEAVQNTHGGPQGGRLSANHPSICLYSGPATGSTVTLKQRYFQLRSFDINNGNIKRYSQVSHIVSPTFGTAWLGTGDAELGSKTSVRRLQNHYGDLLKSVRIFGLPHHGSDYNWNSHLCNALPNSLIGTIHTTGSAFSNVPGRNVLTDLSRAGISNYIVNNHTLRFKFRVTF